MSVLPVVGSSGFYTLAAPFDVAAQDNVEYTCMAVRRISDYQANNEKVQEEIYTANEIDEVVWEEDLEKDAYIVSLQSKNGHWLYVPARYVLAYPSVNGVQYRTLHIGIALPAMPLEQNLDQLLDELKQVTDTSLGVSCRIRTVEASKVQIIPFDEHEASIQTRLQNAQGRTNLYARYKAVEDENVALRAKLAKLEAYIKANYIPATP